MKIFFRGPLLLYAIMLILLIHPSSPVVDIFLLTLFIRTSVALAISLERDVAFTPCALGLLHSVHLN